MSRSFIVQFFIAAVGLIIVRLCTAHQLGFLWPESHLRLAQNFHTGLTFIKKDSRKNTSKTYKRGHHCRGHGFKPYCSHLNLFRSSKCEVHSSIHRQKLHFKNNCRSFKEKENTVKSFHELEGIGIFLCFFPLPNQFSQQLGYWQESQGRVLHVSVLGSCLHWTTRVSPKIASNTYYPSRHESNHIHLAKTFYICDYLFIF